MRNIWTRRWNMAAKSDYLSASKIAQLGFCEHRVRLEATLGERTTSSQDAAREAGDRAHARFHHQGQIGRTPEPKRWCFVATALYGETAPETDALRQFRDRVLRRSAIGRALIARYYRHSPSFAAFLLTNPRLAMATRAILRPIARATTWLTKME